MALRFERWRRRPALVLVERILGAFLIAVALSGVTGLLAKDE